MPYVHIWSWVKCISLNGNDCFGIVCYFTLQQFTSIIFRCVCKIVKSNYWLCHVCLSMYLSIPMEQIGFQLMDYHGVWYFSIFWKSVKKTQVSLKSDKNSGSLTWRPMYILIISCWFLLIMRNVSDKSCRENQNTFYIQQCFSINCAIYEILWN